MTDEYCVVIPWCGDMLPDGAEFWPEYMLKVAAGSEQGLLRREPRLCVVERRFECIDREHPLSPDGYPDIPFWLVYTVTTQTLQ